MGVAGPVLLGARGHVGDVAAVRAAWRRARSSRGAPLRSIVAGRALGMG